MADLRLTRAKGWKSFFGWATEDATAAYGTHVAATSFQRMVSENVGLVKPTEFGHGLGAAHRTDPWQPGQKVEGSITQKLNYHGLEIPLFQLMGTGKDVVREADPSTGLQGFWTFLYNEALPMGVSVDINRDLKEFMYAGCQIPSAEFKFIPGQIGEVTWNILGRSQTTGEVKTKNYTEYVSWQPILCTECTVSYGASDDDDGDVSSGVSDVTIKVDNHQTEIYPVNSNLLLQPVRSGEPNPVTVSADLNMWFRDYDEYDFFQDSDDVGLKVKNSTTPGGIIEAGYFHELNFDIPFARITPTADPVVSGAGLIMLPLHLEAFLEQVAAPDEIITIELKNANTTAIVDGL